MIDSTDGKSSVDFVREWIKAGARRLGFCPVRLNLITGAPRTGTSAVFRWLKQSRHFAAFYESRILVAAHYFLSSAGRFKKLSDERPAVLSSARKAVANYYASQRLLLGRRLLEKEPLEPVAFADESYRPFLGHVQELYPTAKIILMTRDPLAVVWSMVQRTWGKSLTEAESRVLSIEEACQITSESLRIVSEMRDLKNVYVCEYDQLMSSPAKESRQVCDFIGIPLHGVFIPRESSTIGFSPAERGKVLELIEKGCEPRSQKRSSIAVV